MIELMYYNKGKKLMTATLFHSESMQEYKQWCKCTFRYLLGWRATI